MGKKQLFARNISTWGSLRKIESREFSYLLDPGLFGDGAEGARLKGFHDVWSQLKTSAKKNGFDIKDRKKDQFKEALNTREYYDTPDFALRNKGFLIRVSTDYIDGKPKGRCTLVVKENSADEFKRVFRSKLAFRKKYAGKTEIEENVFLDADLNLDNSLEVAKKITLNKGALGNRSLGDFGNIIPHLLKLGLPDDAPLICHKTYSYDVKPGRINFTPQSNAVIKLELWTKESGAVPFVGDLSFTVMTDHYDDMVDVHNKAEQFSVNVLGRHGAAFAFSDAARWGGSKTRMLLGLPVTGD